VQLTLHTEMFAQAFRRALATAYQAGRERSEAAGVKIPLGGRMSWARISPRSRSTAGVFIRVS
jgi:ribosomal protein S3